MPDNYTSTGRSIDMKHFYCLFLAALVLCGCTKKKEAEPTVEQEEILISNDPAVELGIILTEASLMELKEDGKMYWKANLNAADTVIWKNEQKDAPRSFDGQVRTFYRVEMDGDYWVQDYAIAGPAKPAVITTDETILYTKPDITAVAKRGNITVPKYALVAVLDKFVESNQFVMISARLEGAGDPSISELYVKAENVSMNNDDVGAVKLARIASVTKNASARKELLKNAMKLAEGSKSFNSIAAGLNDDLALFELELTDNLDRLDVQGNYVVTADSVNKREFPSVDGTVAGTMSYGDVFWVSLRTKKTVSLPSPEEGEPPLKGRWLRTEDGRWVFSAFVSLLDSGA